MKRSTQRRRPGQTATAPVRSIKRWNAPFAKRLAIVAAILIVAQTLVFAIERRVKHAVVAPLPFSVIDCPMQLGDWTGADEPLDERIFQALGASEQVLRRYVKSTGEMVSIHIATWDSYRGYTPHTPLVCLPGAGWSIRSQRSIDLAGAGVTARNAKALYCDRESEPLVALYWYRLGQDYYVDRSGGKRAHRAVLLQGERPPLLKVLLTIRTHDRDKGTRILREIGQKIDSWMDAQFQAASGS